MCFKYFLFIIKLLEICVPKFPIKYEDLINSNNNIYNFYLIVSYDDGTIGFIDRINYNQSLSQSINTLTETNSAYQNVVSNRQKFLIKKQRVEQYITSLDQSLTGTIGVGTTNTNCLIVFRQTFLKDLNTNLVTYFLNFYEYLMFSGNDYWDLLACMKQKLADLLIERLEERYLGQPLCSIQRAFFMRYYALLYSLYRQSTNGLTKSIDILTKLELNRCSSIITYSIQSIPLNLNEQNFSLIDSVDEVLKYKHEPKVNLLDIVQNIIRKNTKIIVTQQLRHLFQWVIDIALYLLSISNKPQQQQQHSIGISLLTDAQFINEIRKCLIYAKILFLTVTSQSLTPSPGATAQSINNTIFLYSSLPVLPVRSSSTKDLISDLFNVYTKFYNKSNEKPAQDDLLHDQCSSIKAETLIKPMDELLCQIKQPWLGINLTTKSCMKLSIEYQFNEEKLNKKEYPLFDIIRFIYFSRNHSTKQCYRCANYSEMNDNLSTSMTGEESTNVTNNCIYILDSSSDKCICGGLWMLPNLA